MKLFGPMAAVPAALLALCFGSSAAAQLSAAASPSRQPPAAATGLDNNGHFQAVSLPVDEAFAYARLTSGVQARAGGITKQVIFYGPDTVRVNANQGENYWTAPSLTVIGKPQLIPFTLDR